MNFNYLLVLWSKSYTNSVQSIGDLAITWRDGIQEFFELVRKYRLRLGRGRIAAAASYRWMVKIADWRKMRDMSLKSQQRISSLQHLYWSFVFLSLFLILPFSLIFFSLLLLLFSSLLSHLILLLLSLLLHFSPTF